MTPRELAAALDSLGDKSKAAPARAALADMMAAFPDLAET